MRSLRVLALATCCLLPALAACSTSGKGVLRLYQRNNGDQIDLRVGESMEVVLDADPTINVHWLKIPGDPNILEQIGGPEPFTDVTTPDFRTRLLLRFRAVAAGKTRLQLVYKDRYRRNTDPDVELDVRVIVSEPK